jgi:hypothetical protein
VSVYTCALCGTAHDSVQAALRCCAERFEDGDDPDADPDHWTCADCGRFATPTFRADDGDRCVWCGADQRREARQAARDRPAPGVDVDPIATAPEEAVADDDLRTDGGRSGGWLLVESTWHRSVEYDGYIHGCRCGREVDSWARWARLGRLEDGYTAAHSVCEECDDRDLRTDGGRTCAHCGATLPAEIDEGTGVYCTECGHGQLVTDGGAERSGDERMIVAMEQQAAALEAVAEQQRVQTAALVELIRTLDHVAVAVDDHHSAPANEVARSGRSVAGSVEDAALEVAERVDLDAVDQHADDDDLRTDGGEVAADEIGKGKLAAARSAGAHDEFIAFVAEYPDSGAAETLETAISLDALDEFEGLAGSFVGTLWRDGAKKASNADLKNGRRIRELFDRERWPEWMQQEYPEDGDDDLRTDGGDRVGACPECDSTDLFVRGSSTFGPDAHASDGRYHCRDCGAGFDEPVRRARRGRSGQGRRGLAGALANADADDLRPDGGTRSVASSEPRTPYEPARAWSSVDELDGIDLREGDGCPHCGGRRDELVQNPAGWYSCYTCGVRWAGELDDATLHDEPYRGPAVEGDSAPEEGSE